MFGKFDFDADKPYIADEYADAHFDPDSGADAATLAKMLDDFIADGDAKSLPMLTLRAESFRLLVENAQIEANPHTPFADKINAGIDYTGWAGWSDYEKILKRRSVKKFSTDIPEAWQARKWAYERGLSAPDNDFWHICPNWDNIMTMGVVGLYDRAQKLLDAESDEKKRIFYTAAVSCCRSLLTIMKRYADMGDRVGNRVFADCMRALMTRPPQTLYEAMELSLFMMSMIELGIERTRTLGNVGVLFYPFYLHDTESGLLDRDGVKTLCKYFLTKINAGKRYADQPICIGGYDKDGKSGVNELVDILLEAYREENLSNPKLHIRYNGLFPEKTYDTLIEMMIEGNSSMVIISDQSVIAAYDRIGMPREKSKNYLPLGCYECIVPNDEDARICSAWINLAKGVELAVTGGRDLLHGDIMFGAADAVPQTFDAFYAVYKHYLLAFIDFCKENVRQQEAVSHENYAAPLLSLTHDDCMKNGADFFSRGMDIHNSSIKCCAIGTAVDALLAVKKFVYEQKRLTLPQLAALLENNWQGAEALRTEIRKDKGKWGNGDREADALAADIYRFCGEHIVGTPNGYGGVYRMGADSVDNAENFGRNMGATADGRLAGEPLSKNMRPVNGMEFAGITGFIRSMLALDQELFIDGAPLDFMLHPSAVSGEKGRRVLGQIIKSYFAGGGQMIQGNIVSAEMLEKAVADPDSYRNLQIRVCGWNEYFVNMKPEIQKDFIERAKGLES